MSSSNIIFDKFRSKSNRHKRLNPYNIPSTNSKKHRVTTKDTDRSKNLGGRNMSIGRGTHRILFSSQPRLQEGILF